MLYYNILSVVTRTCQGVGEEIIMAIPSILDNPRDIYNALKEFDRLDKLQLERLREQKQL